MGNNAWALLYIYIVVPTGRKYNATRRILIDNNGTLMHFAPMERAKVHVIEVFSAAQHRFVDFVRAIADYGLQHQKDWLIRQITGEASPLERIPGYGEFLRAFS